MAHTVTEILAGVRRRYFSSDATAWPDADIIALINEVMNGQVVPWIEKHREDHFIKTSDQALTGSQNNYVMPTDAVATQLFSVHLVNSSGNIVNPPLVETELETFTQLFTNAGIPQRYAIRGNEVLLWPTPSDSSYTLRFQYARRPSDLVARTAVGQITAINTGPRTVTVDITIPGATTSTVMDLVKANAGYEVYSLGAPSSVAGTTVGFSSTFSTVTAYASVGDFVCLSRQAPVLTYIPEELWPVVYQAVVVEMSSSKGDDEQLARAEKALARLIKAAEPTLQKRVTAAHRKLPGGARWGMSLYSRLTRPY